MWEEIWEAWALVVPSLSTSDLEHITFLLTEERPWHVRIPQIPYGLQLVISKVIRYQQPVRNDHKDRNYYSGTIRFTLTDKVQPIT